MGNFKKMQARTNITNPNLVCACCGGKDGLSSHHVVPRRFMKGFKNREESRFNRFFVLQLCVKCHSDYEYKALSFSTNLIRTMLSKEDLIPVTKMCIVKEYTISDQEKKPKIKLAFEKKFNEPIEDYIELLDSNIHWTSERNLALVNKIGERKISEIWIKHFLENVNIDYLSERKAKFLKYEWERAFDGDTMKLFLDKQP